MTRLLYFITLTILFHNLAYSQSAPELINYQGLARDASGQPLSGQGITVSFTIWQGTPGGTNVFTETHNKSTNNFGLFDLKIGSINTSAFQAINWANGPYHLEVAINGNSLGSQQMVSVPYALYAKSAGNVNLQAGNGISISGGTITNTAPGITYTSGTNVSITSGSIINATPQLSINDNTLSISGGTSVVIPTLQAGTNVSISGGSIHATPSLALNSNSLSISGGNTVVLPAANSINISGIGNAVVTQPVTNSFVVNVPQQTLSINGDGNNTPYSLASTSGGTVILPQTSVSINPPHNINNSPGGFFKSITVHQPTLVTPGFPANNIISVNSSTNLNYTITAPPASLSINNGLGTSTLSISHGTTTVNSVTFTNGNNSGFFWSLNGNTITSANFLGSTNNIPVAFYVNNSPVMRLFPSTFTAGILGLGAAAQSTFTPQSLAHFLIPNSTFTSALRLGHANQPALEWHFDVNAASNMFLKNENSGSPITVMTFSNNGKIGINNANPSHLFDLVIPTSSNNINAVHAVHNGTGSAAHFEATSVSNSSAVINVNSLNNGPGISLSSSGNSFGIRAVKSGTSGNAVYIESNNTSNTSAALNINYSHNGSAINIFPSASLNIQPIVNISHSTAGNGIRILSTSNSTNAAIFIDKNTSNGTGLSVNMGTLSVSDGININHSGNGGNGLYTSKSGLGQAILATSSGTGSTLYSEKTSGAGEAAAFFNSSSTNTSPVVFIQNTGTGNSNLIFANNISGSGDVIVANALSVNSKNSIVLQNGHIKSISGSVPVLTYSASNTFTSFLISSLLAAASTDVKGQVLATFTSTFAVSSGDFFRFNIAFTKPYSNQPIVVITPVDILLPDGVQYSVMNVTTSSFEIEVKNTSNFGVSFGFNTLKFNYFVIE